MTRNAYTIHCVTYKTHSKRTYICNLPTFRYHFKTTMTSETTPSCGPPWWNAYISTSPVAPARNVKLMHSCTRLQFDILLSFIVLFKLVSAVYGCQFSCVLSDFVIYCAKSLVRGYNKRGDMFHIAKKIFFVNHDDYPLSVISLDGIGQLSVETHKRIFLLFRKFVYIWNRILYEYYLLISFTHC